MSRVRMGTFRSSVVLLAALLLSLCFAQAAYAAENYAGHDGDVIRSLLQSNDNVVITLDADVDWSASRLDTEAVKVTLPNTAKGMHPIDHEVYTQVWATLGSGEKTIDLAGHDFDISVDDAGQPFHLEQRGAQLYMIDIPSGAKLTIDDSSGTNKGSIIFDGYLHNPVTGSAGLHESAYKNENVVYRNVLRVSGGDLTFNGGTIKTRKKLQYVSPARPWDSLTGGSYTGNVSQQVNCVGITIQGGSVLVNGGVISGRGYRYMYAGDIDEGLYYSSVFLRAAAIYAESGSLTINDGTFNGMGNADVINWNTACDLKVRAGYFHTHKVDYALAPSSMDSNAQTGTARYITDIKGRVGLWHDAVDTGISKVVSGGYTVAAADFDNVLSGRDDVYVVPVSDAPVVLSAPSIDPSNALGEEFAWNGNNLELQINVADSFAAYPWRDGYYEAYIESSKVGTAKSPKVMAHGHVYDEGGAEETVAPEKVVKIEPADAKAQLSSHPGYLSFNLKDLLPDGMEAGDSFVLRVRYSENLMPYDGARCTGTLQHSHNYRVNIQPDALSVSSQPANTVGTFGVQSTLTANVSGAATSATWYEVWPEYQKIDAGVTFDSATGASTLSVDCKDTAHYYRCEFSNGFERVVTSTACLMPELESAINITGDDSAAKLYEDQVYGSLTVTGALADAFQATLPSKRSVVWYKDGVEVARQDPGDVVGSGHYAVVASTTQLKIASPTSTDVGTYKADVTVDINGTPRTFTTGNFAVTVEPTCPTTISWIELFGIGAPYLGDTVPEVGEGGIHVIDPRYEIESITWTGATPGRTYSVPTAQFSIVLKATGSNKFEHGGAVPVYLDGSSSPVGTASVGSTPNTRSSYSYTFSKDAHHHLTTPNSAADTGLESLDGIDIGFTGFAAAPGADVDLSIVSDKAFTATGQVKTFLPGGVSSASASSLPWWLTLSSDGHLTGTVPSGAASELLSLPVSFKTSSTGDSSTIASGFSLLIAKQSARAAMSPASEVTHVHTWEAWADNGDNTHTHVCTACTVVETAAHNWDDGEVTVEPTKGHPGVMTYTCEDCGATYTDAVPYEDHSHLTFVAAKEPTCTEDGNVAYYECDECGLKFADANAETEIADGEEVVPATGHDWDEWIIDKPATATETGLRHHVCKNDASHVERQTTHLITFDLAGGTLEGKTGVVELQAGEGEVITIPNAPTRIGYLFAYWKGSEYHPGDSYTVQGNHTFTAVWTKVAPAAGYTRAAAPKTGDTLVPLGVVAGIAVVATAVAVVAFTRMRKQASDAKHSKR